VLRAADCCCSIMRSVRDAMADPHFAARGIFANRLANAEGEEIAALPTPIAEPARARKPAVGRAPALGEHTRELLGEDPA